MELDAVGAGLVDRPHHFDQGAVEVTKLPDHQNVFRLQVGEGGLQFGPLDALSDFFSSEMFSHPAQLGASRCMSRFWSAVETRACPMLMQGMCADGLFRPLEILTYHPYIKPSSLAGDLQDREECMENGR